MNRIAWPSGGTWTVGSLEMPASQLVGRGITFESLLDGLGPVELAALYDPEIGDIVLQYSPGATITNTDVIVDAGIERERALAAVLRLLNLSADDFAWLTPYGSYSESVAAPKGSIVRSELHEAAMPLRSA